ncbi:hypothetical protein RJT34_31895 [Clitoria ternatea]|uniref:BHLH domain-containing protein n=1 Tax=Clitoria ternatea TaxID=43366 RepID=A0AAN9F2W5_CLITE
MLHCLNTSGNLVAAGTDNMTVLERQRARIKHQQQPYFSSSSTQLNTNTLFSSSDSSSLQQNLPIFSADPALDNAWPQLPIVPANAVSRTCARPQDKIINTPSSKKRKPHNSKIVPDTDNNVNNKDKKKMKVSVEEGESKITQQTTTTTTTNNNNNNRESISADNSKGSEVQNQKPEYIHVRARRGQATDSHSLAERVRREKISERMKYLQDLVPGCNKVAGKAGMLDEIINYVQSLQRQVEFLSMKLAAVNPRLDFNIDELFTKEVFPSCAQSFPNIGMPSDLTNNPAYLQFSSAQQQQQQQQLVACCGGLINNTGISPQNMGLRRNFSTSVSIPETFLDSSCFTQILPSSNWEGDFQNLYNVAFDQGRTTPPFPSQPFTGLVEASSLKMEM